MVLSSKIWGFRSLEVKNARFKENGGRITLFWTNFRLFKIVEQKNYGHRLLEEAFLDRYILLSYGPLIQNLGIPVAGSWKKPDSRKNGMVSLFWTNFRLFIIVEQKNYGHGLLAEAFSIDILCSHMVLSSKIWEFRSLEVKNARFQKMGGGLPSFGPIFDYL